MITGATGTAAPVRTTRVDALDVRVYDDRGAMGAAAGTDVAAHLRTLLARQATVRMIFAAAPSQAEMLATLRVAPDLDWSRVVALHMDEYLDLPVDAPQRFGRFLADHLFAFVRPGTVEYIAAAHIASDDAPAITDECARYAALVRAAPMDIVCLGVGENGHIAFNDPPVADFADPATIKPVVLDAVCRQQQVNDGCFPDLASVPRRALTLTVPALLSGARLFCTVPGPTKRAAVRAMLTGPTTTDCPASALRHHPACTLYLDPESESDVA